MGCFGFKLGTASTKRKGKRRSQAEDGVVGGGEEDGRLVPTKMARDQEVDAADGSGVELTAAGENSRSAGPRSLGSGDESLPAAADDVEMRGDLPGGGRVGTASLLSTASQARQFTKEYLLSEIDSLRAELDMRREELQALKKDYEELGDMADRLERSRRKASELAARVEDLQEQLAVSRESERELAQQLEEARAALDKQARDKELLLRRLDEAEYKMSLMAAATPQAPRASS